MESRIGRFVCIIKDSTGKLDLYREKNESEKTRLFDSEEEAAFFLKNKNIDQFNILEIKKDTF